MPSTSTDDVDPYGHDLFQEAELLREVVAEIRDDPRAAEAHDELLVELRAIRAAVARTTPGGVR